jgi:glycosyltransferase involved in cell wall biosynthesis
LRAKPTIALTVIMRDEAPVLPAFLASVKPWFTTIYIVDTGSVDDSVQIALDYGAIVSHRPWDFSFSNARNYALDQMQGEEFGAFADCDDTLPPECGEGIQRLIMMADDRISGWLMQVHIPPPPGGEGFTIVDHLKIWRAGRGYRWTGRIHEQLLGSIRAAGGLIERTSLYYVHSGYDYSPPGQKKKHDRDEYLLRLDEEENPDASFPRFNSAMSRFHWGEFDVAIAKFHECIERADPYESTMRKVYAMLCGCYVAKRDFDNARKVTETGLSLTPNDPELLFRAGNLFRDLGDLPVAERFYLKLLTERESGHIDSRDVSIETYKGHHNLAGLYIEMARLQDAEIHFRAALQHHPAFAPSLVELGSLFVKQRRFQDAADVAVRLDAVNPGLAQALRQSVAAAQNTRAI